MNESIYINKMEDEYFRNNMVIYIEKKITEKFSYNLIVDEFKNIKKNDGQSFIYV